MGSSQFGLVHCQFFRFPDLSDIMPISSEWLSHNRFWKVFWDCSRPAQRSFLQSGAQCAQSDIHNANRTLILGHGAPPSWTPCSQMFANANTCNNLFVWIASFVIVRIIASSIGSSPICMPALHASDKGDSVDHALLGLKAGTNEMVSIGCRLLQSCNSSPTWFIGHDMMLLVMSVHNPQMQPTNKHLA